MNRVQKLIIMGVVIISVSLSSSVFAKKYTKEQFLEMGGYTLSGVVTKVGVYNFYIIVPSGEEINVHTDKSTIQFNPEDERLMVGDEISFIYLSHESASLSTDKKMAQYVEFIKKTPRKFLTEEMECIVSISQRNEKACYLPQYHKTVSFEGRWPDEKYQGREINTSIGSNLLIKLKVIPANIGNGYVYIVRSVKPATN